MNDIMVHLPFCLNQSVFDKRLAQFSSRQINMVYNYFLSTHFIFQTRFVTYSTGKSFT